MDTIPPTIQEPPVSYPPPNNMEDSLVAPTLPPKYKSYDEPTITVQPKSDWKSRYPKDLILKPKIKSQRQPKKGSKRKRNTRKQIKKIGDTISIGLLQGVGNQRSLIELKVNCSFYYKRFKT